MDKLALNIKGTLIDFLYIKGVVLSSDKHSETHVSSGGGGYVSQQGGHVSAPTISSYAVTKHEFWVREDGGREQPIQLSGVDIPLRVGQRVGTVYTYHDATKVRKLVLVAVPAAQRYWNTRSAGLIAEEFGVAPKEKTILNIVLIVVGLMVPPVLIYLAYRAWRYFKNQRLCNAEIETHLDKIGQAVLSDLMGETASEPA